MEAGVIQQIWRYPVKSMGGERIERADVTENGIAGDRRWAVYDLDADQISGAKRIPALLGCRARTLEMDGRFAAEITLPDGSTVLSDERERLNGALSALCKRPVRLEELRSADDLDFYRYGNRQQATVPAPTLNDVMGLEAGDPFPDFSGLPPAIREFATPPGTFFDAYALHIVTTASLAEAARLEPEANFDVRRFRPNVVLATPAGVSGFVEFEWTGKTLFCGEVAIGVHAACVRCSMVMAEQPGLPRDRRPLRTLISHTGQDFGIYCTVAGGGTVGVGDQVTLQ